MRKSKGFHQPFSIFIYFINTLNAINYAIKPTWSRSGLNLTKRVKFPTQYFEHSFEDLFDIGSFPLFFSSLLLTLFGNEREEINLSLGLHCVIKKIPART